MPIVRYPRDSNVYWSGKYSECRANGSIEQYVDSVLRKLSLPVSGIFLHSDGIIGKNEHDRIYARIQGTHKTLALQNEATFSQVENQKEPGTYPIVCTLCSRDMDRTNILLTPLDDDTFQNGIQSIFTGLTLPAWEDRENVVFWRGGSSGYDRPSSLRMDVTAHLYDRGDCDVRITPWGNWENEFMIRKEYFAERCDMSKHVQYKYLLIVDGNCIASNHQWVFGSGAVPIMITHPKNDYWFKRYLKPMINYVPVAYDLSDLHEKIDWLQSHPQEAKSIAQEALRFSETIFSPEFQKYHIETELYTMLFGSSAIEYFYREKSTTPSDIHEHLPTLREYASRCNSVTECGVREIVSSYAFASGLKQNPKNSLTMIDLYTSAKMKTFLELCQREGVHASFIEGSDTSCERFSTDLLFIDTWHIYGHLKRELAYWHSFVGKYIILHDTTVDAWYGETIRGGGDPQKQSIESGYPVEEITRGLWPAVEEFLRDHPEWSIERRYENNNGLTILSRA